MLGFVLVQPNLYLCGKRYRFVERVAAGVLLAAERLLIEGKGRPLCGKSYILLSHIYKQEPLTGLCNRDGLKYTLYFLKEVIVIVPNIEIADGHHDFRKAVR